jgi:hypothetical protein
LYYYFFNLYGLINRDIATNSVYPGKTRLHFSALLIITMLPLLDAVMRNIDGLGRLCLFIPPGCFGDGRSQTAVCKHHVFSHTQKIV